MKTTGPILVCALVATLAAALFSADSLRKGQVIKQFEIYSVADSLAHDSLGVFRTSLPCEGKIKWVHELPVFHSIGALGIRALPGFTAVVPLLGFFALALAFAFFWAQEFEGRELWIATLLSAWSPAFLRYSIQFVPDVWAAAALVTAVGFLRRERVGTSFVFFAIAGATKALYVAPALMVLGWYFVVRAPLRSASREERLKRVVLFGVGALATVLPYLTWSVAQGIAGVQAESSVGHAFRENSFLGPVSLLWSPHLYARYLLWLFVKGAGLPLALGAVLWFVETRRAKKKRGPLLLAWWFAGSVPFFLIIRQANIVHDYYCMGFVIPVVLAGAGHWVRSLRRRPWLAGVAMALSVLTGVWSLASLRPVPLAPGELRPSFCGRELFGDTLEGREHLTN